MKKQLKILIEGRVQGVFFRVSTKRMAKRLELLGYVKNMAEGQVEIVAEGEEENLRKLLNWSYRGPLLAKVKNLSYSWKQAIGNWTKFNTEK